MSDVKWNTVCKVCLKQAWTHELVPRPGSCVFVRDDNTLLTPWAEGKLSLSQLRDRENEVSTETTDWQEFARELLDKSPESTEKLRCRLPAVLREVVTDE